jgi:DNA-binding NarL/FixJ family response regulator
MRKVRIYIADDQKLVREGFAALLHRRPDFQVVGEAGNGREMLREIREAKPDIILLDISMPELNGIDAINQVKRIRPTAAVVMLSVHNRDTFIAEALNRGAQGYLLKDISADELFTAIDAVTRGEMYCSKEIEQKVIRDFANGVRAGSKLNRLTNRQREVFQLIAEGNTGKQIAEKLNISPKTVENHRSKIMSELDIRRKADLILIAIKERIIEV